MIKESKQTIHYICFLFSRYYVRSYYVADSIKNLELSLTAVSVLLKISFGKGQIIVPKIGMLISKTACINLMHVF